MDFSVEDTENNNGSLDKYIQSLTNSVKRTISAIAEKMIKSKQRFKQEIDNCDDNKKKQLLERKLERLSKELHILDSLREDDISRFALTTHLNVMAVAVNPRLPKELRLKARVASHKPLSTHLLKVKEQMRNDKLSAEESDEKGESETEATSTKGLNKMCVNNQIVKMRKDVKRAKIHIIHKLSRNIKKLRSCKGENKEKLAKKADRFAKKIICIKELHEDTVSRFALTCTKDLTKMASDVKLPVQSQVMAALTLHKFVSDSLAAFKNLYPSWRKDVPKILKQKKKKRKLSSVTKENDHNSPSKKPKKQINVVEVDGEISPNRSKENENEDCDTANESDNTSEQSTNDNETNANESDQIEVESEESDTSIDDRKENKQNDISADESEMCSRNFSDITHNDNVINMIKTKKMKTIDSKISKKPQSVKFEKGMKKIYPPNKTREVEKETPKVVDPFFVTSTNEDYVTNQVPVGANNLSDRNPANKHFQSKNSEWFDRKKKPSYSTGKFNKDKNFAASNPYPRQFDQFGKKDNFKKAPSTEVFSTGNRRERRKALTQPIKEEKVERLHPSWEAKKKMASITSFQGKKITFD